MVKGLKLVTRNQAPMLAGAPIMDDTHGFGPRRLTWGPGAKQPYLDYANDARKIPEGRRRDLFIRAPEQAARIATVVALHDGWLQVNLNHFEWAWEYAKYSRDLVLLGTNERMVVKRDFAEVCRAIKGLLETNGPMRRMDLHKKLRSAAGQYGMEIVDNALWELTQCGEVREIPHDEQISRKLRPEVGAPGRWFELT
jgi:hypothetical protein